MADELIFRPVAELAALLDAKKVSSGELLQAFVARRQAVDGRVKAFNSLDEAGALALAAAAEPPELPPGTRDKSQGFAVGPNAEFSVEEPIANSSMFSRPKGIAPAALSLVVTVAS